MKNKFLYRAKGRKARRSLRLPDLEHAKTAVLSSPTNPDAEYGLPTAGCSVSQCRPRPFEAWRSSR